MKQQTLTIKIVYEDGQDKPEDWNLKGLLMLSETESVSILAAGKVETVGEGEQ